MKSKAVLYIVFSFFFNPLFFGQKTIISSGGDATGSGGSSSYSIGQIVYKTNNAAAGETSAEGVQHPYEIYAYSSIDEVNSNLISISISPNPTSDIINIKSSDYNSYSYLLYQLNGELIKSGPLNSKITTINLENYSRASYLLKINKKNQLVKSFKIIKN